MTGSCSSAQQRVEGLLLVEPVLLQCGQGLLSGEAHLSQSLDLALIDQWRGVLFHPLLRMLVKLLPVLLVLGCHNCVLRVVWLGNAQQGLEGEQGGSDGEGWRPFVLEDVEADGSGLRRNVGMPNFGLKFHLGRLVGVLRRQNNVDLIKTALVASIIGPLDISLPVPVVAVEEAHLHRRFLGLRKWTLTVLANS